MSINYQNATLQDLNGMSDLLTLLLLQEADFKANDELQKNGLKLILDNPEKGQLLIAKDGNKVVGMVNLLFTISTALGAKVAILEDMVVNSDYRNQGIGSELIEEAIVSAKESGCKRITLLTDTDNEEAHKFYKHHGFEKSGMVPFRRIL